VLAGVPKSSLLLSKVTNAKLTSSSHPYILLTNKPGPNISGKIVLNNSCSHLFLYYSTLNKYALKFLSPIYTVLDSKSTSALLYVLTNNR